MNGDNKLLLCLSNSYAMANKGLWNITVSSRGRSLRDKGGDIP